MKTHMISALAAAVAMSATLVHADPLPVKAVDVSADADAPTDMVAFEAYPDLAADITAAVLERAPSLDDVDGVTVHVDIKNLTLNKLPISVEAPAFNELDAVVWFGHGDIVGPITSYAVLLNAYTETTAPAGTDVILLPSSDMFYDGLIDALADNIAANLPTLAQLQQIPAKDNNS